MKIGSKLTRKAGYQILQRFAHYAHRGHPLPTAAALTALDCAGSAGLSHLRRLLPLAGNAEELRARYNHARQLYAHNGRQADELPAAPVSSPALARYARERIDMHGAQLGISNAPADPNAPAIHNFTVDWSQMRRATKDGMSGSTPNDPPPPQPAQPAQPDEPTPQAPDAHDAHTLQRAADAAAQRLDSAQQSAAACPKLENETATVRALVESLRGVRRAIVRTGLEEGEIDLSPSRLALSGAGLALDSAYSERRAPSTRTVAVGVLLDQSGSMSYGTGRKMESAKAAAAAIVRALALGRIQSAGIAYNTRRAQLWTPRTTLTAALRALAGVRPAGDTDALTAALEISRQLREIRADRRVLYVLCDQDYEPRAPEWTKLAAAGIELHGIEIDTDDHTPWTSQTPHTPWTSQGKTGALALAQGWTADLRARLGAR